MQSRMQTFRFARQSQSFRNNLDYLGSRHTVKNIVLSAIGPEAISRQLSIASATALLILHQTEA